MDSNEKSLTFASENQKRQFKNKNIMANSFFSEMQSECTIIVNGVKMTTKEYKAYQKAKNAQLAPEKPKKKVKVQTPKNEVQILGPICQRVIKSVGVVQSLINFIDDGKKEFGHSTDYILRQHRILGTRFSVLRQRLRTLESKMNEVSRLSRLGENDVYQYIENLSYKLDDVRIELEKTMKAVDTSRVMETFKGESCIEATGKRLGLREIMKRSHKSIEKMQTLYTELHDLGLQNGADVSVYNPHTGKRYLGC